MATTDRSTALEVLAALTSAGFQWALLHGRERLEAGEGLSDIDIAVEQPTGTILSKFIHELRSSSLRPFIIWPYDRTGASIFIVRNDLSGGAQLDMLIDPNGTGKYGFRTPIAVDAAQLGPGLPTLAPSDSYLYSIRKRQFKHQHERLAELLEAPPADLEELTERTRALFAEPHGAIVRALLAGHTPPATRRQRWREAPRLLERVLSPSGAWLHLAGPQGAAAPTKLAEKLVPIIPLVRTVDTSHSALIERLPLIGPCPNVRWRAGIVISYGRAGSGATVEVQATQDPLEMAQSITSALAVRAEHHLARWLARRST